ncbi:glutathione-dependent formaldehyde dehydrogenase [Mycobacterium sp. MYCO198283]|uniref:zinc-dependent alcohol dehydrogenase n=1 Tax=Mycobacterium sp. MYCO198283 TaxID=2883505 RepID=UPI001E4D95CE|nr:zinc-dependent alcohol dehydrogenase [Mycobacterium sp. MYCO198283]MCG5434395.1 glutathione-dependent formaldehyde dehydrogenase [Mycobacterium sp. MYCO198283]
MRAVTWQGKRKMSVENVPDPVIQEPTDAIVRVTSTGICGSDLHLYEVLGAFMKPGDIVGHEAMGIVEEVGPQAGDLRVGDRIVVPFNISCGHCFMCTHDLQSQCETTQNRDQGTGAALFGYSELYGEVAGGQAEYVRVPQAQYTHIKVPHEGPDDRYVYLSDLLPTAWQAVEYANVPDGGTLVVIGLGPIGAMAARIAAHRGYRVIGLDRVTERLDRARSSCETVFDVREVKDGALESAVRDLTDGRGADSVIDAVGMEAHGSPIAEAAQTATGFLPSTLGRALMRNAGVDRLAALYTAITLARRGGTVSLSGVYGGTADPLPMLTIFDKQLTLRMGQANVKRWVPDIMPLLTDDDPLGVDDFATHRLPLEDAPRAYETFQKKQDGMIKVVLKP